MGRVIRRYVTDDANVKAFQGNVELVRYFRGVGVVGGVALSSGFIEYASTLTKRRVSVAA